MLPLVPAQRQQHGVGRHRLIGGTLLIASVIPEDQGRYVCSVNNSAGVVESRTELVFREKLQVRIMESNGGGGVSASSSSSSAAAAASSSTTSAVLLVVDAEKAVTMTCSYTGSPR